jgi:hypothetical protein
VLGPKPVPEPVGVIRGLRERALSVTAEELGLAPSSERPRVWGVLMETGYAEALVILLVLAEGTTSLYFGTGGGVIGAGEHERVRRVATAFLSQAERQQPDLVPTTDYPLPTVGQVRFYVRTFADTRTGEASEEALGNGQHPLSRLFLAGHEVIAAIRESSKAQA